MRKTLGQRLAVAQQRTRCATALCPYKPIYREWWMSRALCKKCAKVYKAAGYAVFRYEWK